MFDPFGLDAEPLRQQGIECAGVALAGRLHVEAQHQSLATGKTQRRPFEGSAAGMLQHAGNAETAIFSAFGRRAPAPCRARSRTRRCRWSYRRPSYMASLTA